MLVILACFSLGMDTRRATQARYSPPCPTSGNATHMTHWDLRRCGKQNAAVGRMKSGSAAGGDRRSAIAARCRGTGARRSAKHSGRRDASDLDRLADYFHAPLHRSRIRWFVLMSHLDVLRDLDACSLCIHSAYNRSSPWNSTKSERRFPGHSSPAPIL